MRRRQPVEQERRDLRLDGELQHIEDELDRRMPADQSQPDRTADHAGQHQLVRCGEEQPDDERDLAQRVRLRVAAEVNVHAPGLGDAEQRRQHREGKME